MKHVVTFGTSEYVTSIDRLRDSAVRHGVDQVHAFHDNSLLPLKSELPEVFKDSKHGFWCWKPYFLLRVLTAVPIGDLVMYCDATTEFTSHTAFDTLCTTDHVVCFTLCGGPYKNSDWTSPACLKIMQANKAEREVQQCSAATILVRNTAETRQLISTWLNWCRQPDTLLSNGYAQHRHDQSILTVLAQRTDSCRMVPDITQHGPAAHLMLWRSPPAAAVRVLVLTASTGRAELVRAIKSVQFQTHPYLTHLVVCDGCVAPKVEGAMRRQLHFVELPWSSGAGGWNGHLVYACFPHLFRSYDRVVFLDDDCWFDVTHVADLVRLPSPCAFSFRYIHTPAGRPVCPDFCESLGNLSQNLFGEHFVDTNCWMLSAEVAKACFQTWQQPARPPAGSQEEVDRRLSRFVFRSGIQVACSMSASVHYTAQGGRSVAPQFFQEGNKRMGYQLRPGRLNVYVFHFSRQATEALFAARSSRFADEEFSEWQMTQLDHLGQSVNLLDGFKCEIPRGAVALINLCHPSSLPLQWLAERTDVRRVCYTAESPNFRHREQWTEAFLLRHFDSVLTYWSELLKKSTKYAFCPHNTHWYEDSRLPLRSNRGPVRSVCCVLEHRSGTETYQIDGMELHRLDGLRHHYVKDLRVDLYGRGWDRVSLGDGARVMRCAGKEADKERAVDIYARYQFAVILENCDADGYVSEKLYDALCAGCIPLYYGNNNEDIALPSSCFVCLRQFTTSADCRNYLAALTDAQIADMQAQLLKVREGVLRRVSQRVFTEAFMRQVAA